MKKRKSNLSRCMLVLLMSLSLFLASSFQSTVYAKTFQLHSRGEQVTIIQTKLKSLGYNIAKITGIYDNSTHRAVMAFQRDHKIKITGKVDEKTMKIMIAAKPLTKPHSTVQPKKRAIPAPSPKPQTVSPGHSTVGGFQAPSYNTKRPGFVPETQPFLAKSKVPLILSTAKKYIGTPYKMGGTTPKAFDCSGYVQYVFAAHGTQLPRTADVQYKLGKNTAVTKLEPGDLVFFSTDSTGEVSHVGIYLGSGQFIHASSSRGVIIDKLSGDYWVKHLYGGKHIVY